MQMQCSCVPHTIVCSMQELVRPASPKYDERSFFYTTPSTFSALGSPAAKRSQFQYSTPGRCDPDTAPTLTCRALTDRDSHGWTAFAMELIRAAAYAR